MDTGVRSLHLVPDASTDFNHIYRPTITAIRREQMPEDVRSAFCSEDIMLFRQPSRKRLSTKTVHAQASSLLGPRYPWCRADDVFAGTIVALVALISLGAASIQSKGTLVFYVLQFIIAALSASLTLQALVVAYAQYRTEVYDSVDLRCVKGVKLHFVHSLATRILTSSSLLLLQQPMANVRSFFRYHRFFTNDTARRWSDQEVDSCIRHHMALGALPLAGLIGDGSHALLGLEPCQNMSTGFGWGFFWLNVLYQSYRDWKRWRLATLVCERLQVQNGAFLQRSRMDGQNPLEGLGGRGGHKWLLVDPKLFSSSLPSEPRAS